MCEDAARGIVQRGVRARAESGAGRAEFRATGEIATRAAPAESAATRAGFLQERCKVAMCARQAFAPGLVEPLRRGSRPVAKGSAITAAGRGWRPRRAGARGAGAELHALGRIGLDPDQGRCRRTAPRSVRSARGWYAGRFHRANHRRFSAAGGRLGDLRRIREQGQRTASGAARRRPGGRRRSTGGLGDRDGSCR